MASTTRIRQLVPYESAASSVLLEGPGGESIEIEGLDEVETEFKVESSRVSSAHVSNSATMRELFKKTSVDRPALSAIGVDSAAVASALSLLACPSKSPCDAAGSVASSASKFGKTLEKSVFAKAMFDKSMSRRKSLDVSGTASGASAAFFSSSFACGLGKTREAELLTLLTTTSGSLSPPSSGSSHIRSKSTEDTHISRFQARQKRRKEEASMDLWKELIDYVDDIDFVMTTLSSGMTDLNDYRDAITKADLLVQAIGPANAEKLANVEDWPHEKIEIIREALSLCDILGKDEIDSPYRLNRFSRTTQMRLSSTGKGLATFESPRFALPDDMIWRVARFKAIKTVIREQIPCIDMELAEARWRRNCSIQAYQLLEKIIEECLEVSAAALDSSGFGSPTTSPVGSVEVDGTASLRSVSRERRFSEVGRRYLRCIGMVQQCHSFKDGLASCGLLKSTSFEADLAELRSRTEKLQKFVDCLDTIRSV